MTVESRGWVWIGGVVRRAEDATVAALDHGLTVGDGVFETAKVVGSDPFALGRHLGRLRRSAQLVGLRVPWTDDELAETCRATIAAARADGPVGRIRVTVTAGTGPLGSGRDDVPPNLIVAAGPATAWDPVTTVATAPWVRNERSAIAGAKSTSYAENVVALAWAHDRGCSEAILANTIGALCEGTGSNVFLLVDGALCTPGLATGCLAGITRELVVELVDVVERDDLTLDDLRTASEAFLTSSTRDIQPIGQVDRSPLPAAPGPRTVEAQAALTALEARTMDP